MGSTLLLREMLLLSWLSWLALAVLLLLPNTLASFLGNNDQSIRGSTSIPFLPASRRYRHKGYGLTGLTDRIATDSLLIQLRGGSNKSEVNGNSGKSKNNNKNKNNNDNDNDSSRAAKDKKRRSSNPKKDLVNNDKDNKSKDKRKNNKRKTNGNKEEEGEEEEEDDDDTKVEKADSDSDALHQHGEDSVGATSTSTSTSTSTATGTATGTAPDESQPKHLSKMFLVDPFRMNELARYEASLESSEDEEAGDVAAEDTSAVGEPELGADNDIVNVNVNVNVNDNDNEEDDDDKRKPKKGGKRKRDRTKAGATTNESSAPEKATTTKADTEVKNGDSIVSENEESIGVAGNDTATTATATATTDESNSYWWVDVWTQHLSDPENFEEEDAVDVVEDVLADANTTDDASDDIGKSLVQDNAKGKSKKSIRDGDKRKGASRKKRDKDNNEKHSDDETPESTTLEQPGANRTEQLVGSDSTSEIESGLSSENDDGVATTADTDGNGNGNVSAAVLDDDSESAPPSYVSSGGWVPIDNLFTIGLASRFPSLRFSRRIRILRKLSARVTGLHGIVSGKPSSTSLARYPRNDTSANANANANANNNNATAMDPESMYNIQKQIAAIDKARQRVEQAEAEEKKRRRKRSFFGFGPPREDAGLDQSVGAGEDGGENENEDEDESAMETSKVPQRSPEEIEEEFQRMERVREIDTLISEGQKQLADLICEKDVLQRRPNPLFNYTTKETIITTEVAINEEATTNVNDKRESSVSSAEANATRKMEIQATREMNFPPDDLVAEYLDMVLSTQRLTKMNHTKLWRENDDGDDGDDDDEEESIGDDLFTASADAHRLYQRTPNTPTRNGNGNGGKNGGKNGKKGGGGSWLLRQSIGNGPTLGEKIGQAAETAAYKAVTAALMSFLARMISSLHGINVMKHSDIRLVLEQSPDLPPVLKDGIIRGDHSNYAEETIKTVMRRKAKRSKKRSSKRRLSEASFLQQEAVTETLLSHVQISAPLLKLFPLAWQRALLGNIIALSCAIISDFVDGLHFQILGHQLSFAFRPITEEDMARQFQMAGGRFNQRRYKAAEFEAAVQATAEDLKEELKFLDSWHERALGSGVLRAQIADMIARIVLTLTDDVLSGAQMDLWSAQAGGPRMLAGLEHRIEEQS